MFCNFTTSKRQGKGTADLMMLFGVLLDFNGEIHAKEVEILSLLRPRHFQHFLIMHVKISHFMKSESPDFISLLGVIHAA